MRVDSHLMPPDATKHRRLLRRLLSFLFDDPGAVAAGLTLAAVLELLHRRR